uniref:Uncharacterized protein n=1 Tax=Arion vulgaris TaxID=1028688 RepID=A0A0B7B2A7_9EUPU
MYAPTSIIHFMVQAIPKSNATTAFATTTNAVAAAITATAATTSKSSCSL